MCPSDIYTSADERNPTALVLWKQPNATDNSGHVEKVTCSPQAGSLFSIGHTKVTCGALDDSGNNATCYFNISVIG